MVTWRVDQLALLNRGPTVYSADLIPQGCRMTVASTATRLISRQRMLAPSRVTSPLVSAVVLNFRRWDETSALVDQLLQPHHIHKHDMEVVVVDNDSHHEPIEERYTQQDRFQFVPLDKNVGFSSGINAGVKHAKGDWLLVLNPDVILCPGFVDLLCGAVRDVDEDWSHGAPIGIVGFRLNNRDGSRQGSTGLFPSLSRMLLGLLRCRKERKYFQPSEVHRQSVPWVTGSCLLIRKDCFTSIQGFDEDYFLYYEDVDLCKRAVEKGWSVCYDPTLSAQHVEPLQNRELTETMRAITRMASLVYFGKHLSRAEQWGLTKIIQTEANLRWCWNTMRGKAVDAQMNVLLLETAKLHYAGKNAEARSSFEEILKLAGLQK